MRYEYNELALKARKKRTILSAIIIVIIIPLTIYIGIKKFDDQKYMIVSLLIILYTMIPFIVVFEKRKPKAREIVTIAMLSSITTVGNLACQFMIPFQPGTALVIISGISLGPEAGFIIGALARLCSNLFVGQGPWTPWQMVCWGILGFLSGIIFNKVDIYKLKSRNFEIINGTVVSILVSIGIALIGYLLKSKSNNILLIIDILCLVGIGVYIGIVTIKSRDFFGLFGFVCSVAITSIATYLLYIYQENEVFIGWKLYAFGAWGLLFGSFIQRKRLSIDDLTLTVFGFVTTFIIYGGIMNIATMVMASYIPDSGISISLDSLAILYISGVPYDFVHALGTAVFLFAFGEKMIQKLERIKIKYGFYL